MIFIKNFSLSSLELPPPAIIYISLLFRKKLKISLSQLLSQSLDDQKAKDSQTLSLYRPALGENSASTLQVLQ